MQDAGSAVSNGLPPGVLVMQKCFCEDRFLGLPPGALPRPCGYTTMLTCMCRASRRVQACFVLMHYNYCA